MTRTKSLALLHQWARPETDNPHLAISMAERDARSHGAAAVRAIRTAQHPTIDGFTDWFGSRSEPKTDREVSIELAAIVPYVITESRLAFRAALNAVGLGRNL